jgi:dihydrofolate reductase
MSTIRTALAMSLDGFIADPGGGAAPYTFVTDGIEAAVGQARTLAGGKSVHLMGASVVQQSIRAGLLDELVISLVPKVLGHTRRSTSPKLTST